MAGGCLLPSCSSSSSSSSFNPVFPRVRGWPDAPHSFSNRFHSLSPSRAICSFLHPQPNLLYILLDLFLPCLLRPSSLSWSIHFKHHCLLQNALIILLYLWCISTNHFCCVFIIQTLLTAFMYICTILRHQSV